MSGAADCKCSGEETCLYHRTCCGNCGEPFPTNEAECNKCTSSFLKFDSGKLELSLIPPEWIIGLAEVLMYGKKKYGAFNWTKCDTTSRYTNAACRHLLVLDHGRGQKLDAESGMDHRLHAAVSCLISYSLDQETRLTAGEE